MLGGRRSNAASLGSTEWGNLQLTPFPLKADLALRYFTLCLFSGYRLTSVLKPVRKSFACNLYGYRVGDSTTLSLMFSGARELGPVYSATLLVAISWDRRVQKEVYPILFAITAWEHWAAKLDRCKRPWPVASGPVAATYLSLKRVGWKCPSAIVWVTPSGRSLDISTCVFAEIKNELRESIDS